MLKFLTHKVTIHLNMFCSFVEHWVARNLCSTFISQNRGVGNAKLMSKSDKRRRSQTISAHIEDIAQYSASMDDLDTVACFLDFQESNEVPKNMQYPIVKRRVSLQPA